MHISATTVRNNIVLTGGGQTTVFATPPSSNMGQVKRNKAHSDSSNHESPYPIGLLKFEGGPILKNACCIVYLLEPSNNNNIRMKENKEREAKQIANLRRTSASSKALVVLAFASF